MNTRHYKPGQRLNSAAEVMQALLDGQKVRSSELSISDHLHLVNGSVVWGSGSNAYVSTHWLGNGTWYIYTPPKRKVKTTRWFAVTAEKVQGDEVSWSGCFSSPEDARYYYPNALAYVKAECEVEVSE
jgi:hypothetical protein